MELYGQVRRAVYVEGISRREAARRFGIDPRTVAKMLAFSVPPGYRRSQPPARPKLDPYLGIIDRILGEDKGQLNMKHQGQYPLRNTINFYFTSNHTDAIGMSKNDRRFFIWEFPPTFSQELIQKLLWFKTPQGVAALKYHLFNHVNVSKFKPKAAAPMTSYKGEMTEAAQSDELRWSLEVRDSPRLMLGNNYQPAMRSSDLVKAFAEDSGRQVTKGEIQKMANAMNQAGFKKLLAKSADDKHSVNLWVIDKEWTKGKTRSALYDWFAVRQLRSSNGTAPSPDNIRAVQAAAIISNIAEARAPRRPKTK